MVVVDCVLELNGLRKKFFFSSDFVVVAAVTAKRIRLFCAGCDLSLWIADVILRSSILVFSISFSLYSLSLSQRCSLLSTHVIVVKNLKKSFRCDANIANTTLLLKTIFFSFLSLCCYILIALNPD